MASEEQIFEAKIEAKRPRKLSPDFPCAVIFYASCLAQLILSFVIFGAKNTETLVFDNTQKGYTCPSGYGLCDGANGRLSHGLLCMTDALCNDVKQCVSSRRLSDEQVRKLAESQVAQDVWEFLEQHAYQPTVMFVSLLIIASLWLVAMQRMPRGVVWGTLVADVFLLLGVFLWFFIETETPNIACLVLAAGMIIFCAVCRKQIETACVMLKTGMDGLFANKRIFFVTFGVQLVWTAFFALWIAAMITRHFVKVVNTGVNEDGVSCGVQEGWTGNSYLGLFFVLHYYWFTYFMRNINVMVITANLSGWYFAEDDYQSNWTHALKWSVFQQAGGNAIASAIMGFLEYLLNRVGSTCNLVVGLLNPLEWIFICIALALKTVAMTYTKFGVIAMTFSGQSFCGSAPKALALLKGSLGDAVVVDYVGKRIMAWCTYIIAVSAGFAMWAWADAVQDISTLDAIGENAALLTFIVFLYAWMISYPFFGLVVVVLIEQIISGFTLAADARMAMNSIFASLFVGCISYFLLNFISGVVVNAMDVSLFCVAVEKKCGQKQERFAKLYDSVTETFVVGTVAGSGNVVVGGAVGGQAEPGVVSANVVGSTK